MSASEGALSRCAHSYSDGLGLGLFIVREVVLAHGGRVEVRSDSTERETTFTVILPRQKPGRIALNPKADLPSERTTAF